MYERDYVYTKRMDGVSVGEVTTRVRQALAAAGFGVLTENRRPSDAQAEAGGRAQALTSFSARATHRWRIGHCRPSRPSVSFFPATSTSSRAMTARCMSRRPSRRSCSVWSGIRRSDRSRRRSTQSSGRFSRPWWVETRRRRRYSTMATIRRPPVLQHSMLVCAVLAAGCPNRDRNTAVSCATPAHNVPAATSATTTAGDVSSPGQQAQMHDPAIRPSTVHCASRVLTRPTCGRLRTPPSTSPFSNDQTGRLAETRRGGGCPGFDRQGDDRRHRGRLWLFLFPTRACGAGGKGDRAGREPR